MSPRTRITTTVDFDVELDQEPQTRSKNTHFRLSRNEPAMAQWWNDQPNGSGAVARLIDEFVQRNGTDDIFEELPVETLLSSSKEIYPSVNLRKASSLAWLNNQRNASGSIRYVIRQHLSKAPPARVQTQSSSPHPARKKKTSGAGTRQILAQVDLCIFHGDAKVLTWIDAQSNRQSSIRRALAMFTQRHGSYTLDGTGTSTFHRAEDHARLIHLNIYDEHIAYWLGEQVDPSAAVRHALNWYVENCTSTAARSSHASRRVAVVPVAPIPASEAKDVTPMRLVDVTPAAKTAEPEQVSISSEAYRLFIAQQEQLAALTAEVRRSSELIQQLIPGAHRG